jgi:CRISPR-associated protein Cas1
MPIFEKPPLATLAPAKDRWTPIYLEHGPWGWSVRG